MKYTPMPRHPDTDLAKKIIAEIVRISGGNVESKTKLFKIFYFAHLIYAKKNPGYLSEWPIVRMPHGPGIGDFDDLFREMAADGTLETRDTSIGPYPAVEFRTTTLATDAIDLTLDAIAAIREAVDFAGNKTAAELSELTHQYSNSWKSSGNGEELNIYVDLLKDDAYEELRKSASKDCALLSEVFK